MAEKKDDSVLTEELHMRLPGIADATVRPGCLERKLPYRVPCHVRSVCYPICNKILNDSSAAWELVDVPYQCSLPPGDRYCMQLPCLTWKCHTSVEEHAAPYALLQKFPILLHCRCLGTQGTLDTG